MPQQPEGYAVIVQPSRDGWQWAITDLDANIAASGLAPDSDSAWRRGMFAAGAIDGLRRAARRGF